MKPFLLENGNAWPILAAVTLDLLAGDPEYMPHMVRYMGLLISRCEPAFRRLSLPPRIQGGLFASAIVLISCTTAWAAISFCKYLSEPAYWLLSTFLIYQAVSLRCLADEVKGVGTALEEQGLEAGRLRLARIVGRNVSSLDEKGIVMAAIESCAENLVDGVISPFFYAAAAGPVAAVGFKAISTLDSMVGYKNERYMEFGTASARMDDIANYIPARLTVIFIAVSAWLLRMRDPFQVLRGVRQDAGKHASPNSGLSEAAFAHSLGIRLFGPANYHGKWVQRPYMNEDSGFPSTRHIDEAVKLLYLTSGLFAGSCFLMAVLY
ncbi:MAG: adenosylcobinamide-phosphate synthase CbiB [Deltaproteobacteria bacterium]|jgi:adenosylcobinamide-phosphate synthase|nr:adenosylcobinamide-phosphate synthase CbiB [Deltaproteobacteria bacterium]